MSDDALDIFDEVTGAASQEFELEFRDKTTTFDVHALSRPRKNALVAALPDGYLEPLVDPDDIDQAEIEEMDEMELKAFFEDHGVSLADAARSRMLDEEATETVIDAIVESFQHDRLGDSEVEQMFRSPKMPDDQFEGALEAVLEASSADDDVAGFRQE